MLDREASLTGVILQKMVPEINKFSPFGAEGLVKHVTRRLIYRVNGDGALGSHH